MRYVVDLSPGRVNAKTMNLVFVTSQVSIQPYGVSKIGWLGIRKMCPSGVTCLPKDCCFSELALKNPTQCVGPVQSGHHHHFIKISHALAMIWLKNCLFCAKQ